jgi:hypothetical protein
MRFLGGLLVPGAECRANRKTMRRLFLMLPVLFSTAVAAQQSSSYRLEEHVLNAGGHPEDGVVAASASFQISLDSIGEGLAGAALSGPSFQLEPGWLGAYRPVAEISGLRFTNGSTLAWDADPAAATYNLYRGDAPVGPGAGGNCEQPNLTLTTTIDADAPPTGAGFFYLVSARNLLDEEGTRGFGSGGGERVGVACP